jgi:isopenicillin N synthase-like dioxygenase
VEIPMIDISTNLRQDPDAFKAASGLVGAACRDGGYFGIRTDAVSATLIRDTFREIDQFYQADEEEKEGYRATSQSQYLGYRGLGREKSRQHSGEEVCEQYRLGLVEPGQPVTPPVDHFEGPFPAGRKLFSEFVELGDTLTALLGEDLGLGSGAFDEHMQSPTHRIGFNLYGVGHAAKSKNSVSYAMSPHVDLSMFTMLTQDAPGLQIANRDGQWMDVPVDSGWVLFILGDYVERWTNGVYHGTPHTVVAVERDRASIQYKHRPSFGTVIEPFGKLVAEHPSASYQSFSTGKEYVSVLKRILGD